MGDAIKTYQQIASADGDQVDTKRVNKFAEQGAAEIFKNADLKGGKDGRATGAELNAAATEFAQKLSALGDGDAVTPVTQWDPEKTYNVKDHHIKHALGKLGVDVTKPAPAQATQANTTEAPSGHGLTGTTVKPTQAVGAQQTR